MTPHLRIARPVSDLARSTEMYCRGLGLTILGSFRDHDGFDGAILGDPSSRYHFEFTHCHLHPVVPTPTADDLLVLYIPVESEWHTSCNNMLAAGFEQVASLNPYWDVRGRTYEDPDGYRTVLERAEWRSAGTNGAAR
jgi:catechol 2,3-dioxygenase-like lactoylglutathione lyase family enzyme